MAEEEDVLKEIEDAEQLSDEQEVELLNQLQDWWDESEQGLEGRTERGDKCLAYRKGGAGMWNPEVLNVLRAEGRPAVSLNDLASDADFLVGTAAQNQTDIKAYNRNSRTSIVAEALTCLVKHTVDQSHGQEEELEQFEDGNVQEIGWLQLMPADDPEEGGAKLVIKRRKPDAVKEDPDREDFDLNVDCKWVCYSEWVDRDKIAALYPDKYDKVKAYGNDGWLTWFLKGFARVLYRTAPVDSKTKSKYKLPLRHTWWHRYKSGWRWKDNMTGEVKMLHRKDDIKKAKDATEKIKTETGEPRFQLAEKKAIKVLYYAQWIKDALLKYDNNYWKCDCNKFGWFNYSAYWKDGYAQGFVDSLIEIDDDVLGPVELTNKGVSGALHIMNQGANAPVFKEQDSLTEDGEKNLVNYGSKPGVIITYKAGKQPPEFKEPPTISQAHMTLMDVGDRYHTKVTGINDPNKGQQQREMSGYLYDLQQTQGLKVNEPKFRKLRRAKRLLGELIVELIVKGDIYDDEQILAILEPELFKNPKLLEEVAESMEPPPVEPEAPPFEEFQIVQQREPEKAAIIMGAYENALKRFKAEMDRWIAQRDELAKKRVIEDIHNMAYSDYGVEVGDSPTAITRRQLNRVELEGFDKAHPGLVDPAILAEAMDLPVKDKIIESIKQREKMQMQLAMQGAGAPQAKAPQAAGK